jgi:microcystin-dependent protein
MPYIVNFTDKENKTPITVFDNTSSTDTSITFPGRNVTGYGQIIAENFLALLENFSSANEPVNPVEGQLWYDSTDGVLMIWDNTSWKAASGIQKGPTEPAIPDSKVGELWVDTTNQQLRIYTGTRWLLVGPSESSVDGLRYGPVVEGVADSDNVTRYILTFYLRDIPVVIISKDSFTPKVIISGFDLIRSGINIADPATTSEVEQFIGGFVPTLYGTAKNADALNVGGIEVAAGKFLRTDVVNTTDFGINVRNNNGVVLGVDGTFNLSTSSTAAKIYNSASGSSIDLQTNRNGIPATILRVVENTVGINQALPSEALDVDGNFKLTGSIIVTSNTPSTNLNNGSIRTVGGVAITKNLIVGDGVDITGVLQTNVIQPKTTDVYDLGTGLKRWNKVIAKTIVAETITGVLEGNISGNSNTATSLKDVTTFQITGDVVSPVIQFDGQVGSYTKTFNTTLTSDIISSKTEPFPKVSKKQDYVLTYRASEATASSSGLFKQTRDTFVGDLGIPIGGIIPYAGATAPYGFLFCDGSEVEKAKYSDLFDVIGLTYSKTIQLAFQVVKGLIYRIESPGSTNWTTFGASDNSVGTTFTASRAGASSDNLGYTTGAASTSSFAGVNTFRLPDLRGRFALGKDNMDNAGTVPISTGGYVDAGGGTSGRVPDVKAQLLGGDAGQSSTSLTLSNLPEHSHTLGSARQDYSAIAVTTTIDPDATTGLGPTAPGQAQYLKDSGGIKKPAGTTLGTAIGLMNPYLTINYIIRSGPPAF